MFPVSLTVKTCSWELQLGVAGVSTFRPFMGPEFSLVSLRGEDFERGREKKAQSFNCFHYTPILNSSVASSTSKQSEIRRHGVVYTYHRFVDDPFNSFNAFAFSLSCLLRTCS